MLGQSDLHQLTSKSPTGCSRHSSRYAGKERGANEDERTEMAKPRKAQFLAAVPGSLTHSMQQQKKEFLIGTDPQQKGFFSLCCGAPETA